MSYSILKKSVFYTLFIGLALSGQLSSAMGNPLKPEMPEANHSWLSEHGPLLVLYAAAGVVLSWIAYDEYKAYAKENIRNAPRTVSNIDLSPKASQTKQSKEDKKVMEQIAANDKQYLELLAQNQNPSLTR